MENNLINWEFLADGTATSIAQYFAYVYPTKEDKFWCGKWVKYRDSWLEDLTIVAIRPKPQLTEMQLDAIREYSAWDRDWET